MSREAEAVLARRARGRHGIVTPALALEAGLSRAGFYRLVEAGLYVPTAHRGVFRAGAVPASSEGDAIAAIDASRVEAYVSHVSALRMWGLGDNLVSPSLHLTTGDRCRRVMDDVIVHRVSYLQRLDVTRLGAVPITSVPVSLLGGAGELGGDDLEDVAIEAVRRRRARVADMLDLVGRVPSNTPGLGNLKKVLSCFDPDEVRRLMSKLESRGLGLVRRSHLPQPRVNRRLFSPDGELIGKVDFIWDPPGLIVEWDGLRFHSTRRQKEHDDARQNSLVLSGRVVLRFSWRDLDDPARVIRDIQAGLELAAG